MPQRLPDSYRDAEVRCVLPVCPERGRFGIAFDVAWDAQAVRVAIDETDARLLMAGLGDYINSLAGNQSPGSPLMPSDAKSVPSDGVNT